MMRTYQLQPNGLEIFFSGRNSLYLTFRTQDERKRCDAALRSQSALKLQHLRRCPTARRSAYLQL